MFARYSGLFQVLGNASRGWWSRDAFSQSAAAAYYAVFSLPGFLMIMMSIAVMVFERQRAESMILAYTGRILGSGSAATLEAIIDNSQSLARDPVPMLVGLVTLLFGATGLFVQLQKSLNAVWEVKVKESASMATFLKDRLTALGITISLGFLLMVSLVLTALLTALGDWLAQRFLFVYVLHGLNLALSLATVTILFALIYKVLPDVHLGWPDALHGGVVAAVLFLAGEYGLNVYFKLAQPGSAFGAAGSIILFLIWIFYSCTVLLFGAEFVRGRIESLQRAKPSPTKIARQDHAS